MVDQLLQAKFTGRLRVPTDRLLSIAGFDFSIVGFSIQGVRGGRG